ncbi:MAG: MoxR family ATPase [Candidatus Riflebacteria bacterium]|nr:MoxR family ATPase [Candidatus Riflebacteria bacterium]
MRDEIGEINQKVKESSGFVDALFEETSKVIVGQKHMLERIVIGFLSNGHILLEGVPGLAKTTAVKTLAGAIQTGFKRIQFTPDLLPADLIGTMIYNQRESSFQTRKGPVFTNILLADEINRAPAKVQSALLEAMQERQVTIGDQTFPLDDPFLVLATQNPIEQEGTYPLPEAQVDRFMLKVLVGYPTKREEAQIIQLASSLVPPQIRPIISPEHLRAARQVVSQIYVDEKVKGYILDIIFAAREPATYGLSDLKPLISYGPSPRASIYLTMAAKAHAFLRHRGYVTPDDVKLIGPEVLRHRVLLTYEAEAEEKTSDDIVKRIFETVEVP